MASIPAPTKQKASQGGRVMKQEREKKSLDGGAKQAATSKSSIKKSTGY